MAEKIYDLETEKKEIQELGLGALKSFFKLEVEDINPKTLQFIHNKAKLAMQFEREMNLSTRAIEMNYIRVFKLVAEDKTELRRLLRKSLPRYL